MARFLVSGNINIETTVAVESFPITYQPTTWAFDGIGSRVSAVGYNLAKALTTLGDNVRLLSIIGRDDAAATIRTTLAADGIDDHFVLSQIEHTAQSVVLYDAEGRRQAFIDLKHVHEQHIPDAHFQAAAHTCDALVLTNIAYNRSLLPIAAALGMPIATDLHAITSLDDSYNQPFLVAADILFMSGERLNQPAKTWAEQVYDRYHPQVLVIGLGAHGAMLALPNRAPLLVPAVAPRPVVSSGGAGDALFAAFLHGYFASGDPETALRRAVIFAGYKIGAASSGEGFLSHAELEHLYAQPQP